MSEFSREELAAIVQSGVENAFARIGLHEDDAQELREDFAHLRRWRKIVEQGEAAGRKAAMWTLVTTLLGLVAMGTKSYFVHLIWK